MCTPAGDSPVVVDASVDAATALHLDPSLITLSQHTDTLLKQQVLAQLLGNGILKRRQDRLIHLGLTGWGEIFRLPSVHGLQSSRDLLPAGWVEWDLLNLRLHLNDGWRYGGDQLLVDGLALRRELGIQGVGLVLIKGKAIADLLCNALGKLVLKDQGLLRALRHQVLVKLTSNHNILLAILGKLWGELKVLPVGDFATELILQVAKAVAPSLQRMTANELLRESAGLPVTVLDVRAGKASHHKGVTNAAAWSCPLWEQLLQHRDIKGNDVVADDLVCILQFN